MGTFWSFVSLIAGAIAAYFLGPSVAGQHGWPNGLAYIVIFLDVALVAYLPLQLGTNYSIFRLLQGPMPDLAGTSCLGLLVMTVVFIVAPVVVFIWLIFPLFGIEVSLPFLT